MGNTGAEPFIGDTDPDQSVARVVFDPEPVEAAGKAVIKRDSISCSITEPKFTQQLQS